MLALLYGKTFANHHWPPSVCLCFWGVRPVPFEVFSEQGQEELFCGAQNSFLP
jgi:hypothetical protein